VFLLAEISEGKRGQLGSPKKLMAYGTMLPEYIAKAVPNPKANRAPCYANTAPAYAGIFLWVAFINRSPPAPSTAPVWAFAYSPWLLPDCSVSGFVITLPRCSG